MLSIDKGYFLRLVTASETFQLVFIKAGKGPQPRRLFIFLYKEPMSVILKLAYRQVDLSLSSWTVQWLQALVQIARRQGEKIELSLTFYQIQYDCFDLWETTAVSYQETKEVSAA